MGLDEGEGMDVRSPNLLSNNICNKKNWTVENQTYKTYSQKLVPYHWRTCRDGPEKNGIHIKSAQMTHSKCLR